MIFILIYNDINCTVRSSNRIREFGDTFNAETGERLTHLCPPLRSTFAVRETASLGIMGSPRVPPLNPSETIVLSEHYRL